tara:strand:- start:3221 stop:3772 length:552 start_codon:yes stop_codon:yes gene_type:complete
MYMHPSMPVYADDRVIKCFGLRQSKNANTSDKSDFEFIGELDGGKMERIRLKGSIASTFSIDSGERSEPSVNVACHLRCKPADVQALTSAFDNSSPFQELDSRDHLVAIHRGEDADTVWFCFEKFHVLFDGAFEFSNPFFHRPFELFEETSVSWSCVYCPCAEEKEKSKGERNFFEHMFCLLL